MASDPSQLNNITQTARRVAQLDLDFAAEKSESPFSNLHWHPCRFPSQIPSVVIGRLTEPGDIVLDPFLGSGTTLTEAQRLGRRGIGIDINPVAALVARSKLVASTGIQIEQGIERFIRGVQIRWADIPNAPLPPTVQGVKWYTANTLVALSKLWSAVTGEESEIGTIARAAFSSVLLPACRETRHWGYVCDNSEPKGDYERDVLKAFIDKLRDWSAAYKDRDVALGRHGVSLCKSAVILADAVEALSSLQASSVKLVLTSPPYSGVADYVKAQRLSMEWFGEDIEPRRRREIGARSKRHRKNATADYIKDLEAVFTEACRVLCDDGWLVIVVGESSQREATIPLIYEMVARAGFTIKATNARQISISRRQMPRVNTEAVIFMRKSACTNLTT